jgi:ATP-dependent DNA helicase RecQ
VEETAEFLNENGVRAGLSRRHGARGAAANQARFLREENIVMCATIAFGMGIDKPTCASSATWICPRASKATTRDRPRGPRWRAASAWMAYGLQDVVLQRRMIDESEADETFKRVLGNKLDAMLGLCETLSCRRVRLLDYFGEKAGPAAIAIPA